MAQLQEVRIYCKWYIDDIPEFDVLVSAWQTMAYLKKLTIATRLQVKSLYPKLIFQKAFRQASVHSRHLQRGMGLR